MSPNRKASHLLACSLSWFITLLCFVSTALSSQQTVELLAAIPACAQPCFRSFVSVNYRATVCGKEPSLQCLCAHVGASGYTIGEGAVQCITAEEAVGFCSTEEANEESVLRHAHDMCRGQYGAIRPSHSALTATIRIPESGGIVTFAPVTTTSVPQATTTHSKTYSTSHSSKFTTTAFRLHTSPKTHAPSSTAPSNPASSTAETSTVTGIPAGAGRTSHNGGDGSGSGPLNKKQAVGISVGLGAAASVAIVAIILARYCRRRKYPSLKTGFLPIRDTWGDFGSEKGQRPTGNTPITQQSRPPSHRGPPPPPPAYNRASWRPDIIGLALSPPFRRDQRERVPKTPTRPVSKLLPAVPVMSMALPRKSMPVEDEQSRYRGSESQVPNVPMLPTLDDDNKPRTRLPAPLKLQIPSNNNLVRAPPYHRERESTMTEFEEDAGTLSSGGAQIWRPPSAMPLSAAPYYVADQYGNWVLGDSRKAHDLVETDAPAPPLVHPARVHEEVKPVTEQAAPDQQGPDSSQNRGQMRPSMMAPADATRAADLPRASSVYSRQSSMPRPLFSTTSIPRTSQPPPRPTLVRARADSADSGETVFSTSSEDCSSGDPTPPVEQQASLSPVAESPLSLSGRSPVTYPKIHDRRSSSGRGPGLRPRSNVAPPPIRIAQYNPPGQPSPTLGKMRPLPGQGMPLHKASQRARPSFGHPGAIRSGSPSMRIVEPSPEPDDRIRLPSAQHRGSMVPIYPRPCHQRVSGSFQPPQAPPYPSFNPPSSRHLSNRYPPFPSTHTQPHHQPVRAEPHRQQRPYHQKPYPQQYTPYQPYHPARQGQPWQPQPPAPPPAADTHSPISERTASTSSSLLAKRLGTGRAAIMAIPTASSSQGQWRRDGSQVPSGASATPTRDDGQPGTPNWLTPTRRGNDMFLNVQ